MRPFVLASSVAALLLLSIVPSVGAAELDPFCYVEAASFSGDDEEIDSMEAPGSGGTLADPFNVDPGGGVEWYAASQGPIMNHNWRVQVYNIPVMFGGDENEGGDTEADGAVAVGDALAFVPLPVTGLIQVSGFISGEGGSCSGSGWIYIEGEPYFSLLSLIGYILTLLGLLMLFFSLPSWHVATAATHGPGGGAATTAAMRHRHPLRAVGAGLLLGLGVSLILISYGQAPVGEWTPLVMLLLFLVLGQAVAWFGPARGREPAVM